jgi:predicted Zn finger-like uncharacterized protein
MATRRDPIVADEKFTQCPGCKTIFRVSSQQLAMREGQVRCGHCRTVFDGELALVSLAPRLRGPDDEPRLSEAELGPPTVTLRDAQALAPVESPASPRRTTTRIRRLRSIPSLLTRRAFRYPKQSSASGSPLGPMGC